MDDVIIKYERAVSLNNWSTPTVSLGKQAWLAVGSPRRVTVIAFRDHLEIYPAGEE
jgi:hypothetical protein